jgi:hypothetical protein
MAMWFRLINHLDLLHQEAFLGEVFICYHNLVVQLSIECTQRYNVSMHLKL